MRFSFTTAFSRTLCSSYLIIIFFLVTTVNVVHSRDISFNWNANPEPTTGYKLYYKIGGTNTPPFDGTGLAAGDSPIILPKNTSATLTGLSSETAYHFTITGYNDTGESDYSIIHTLTAEISESVPDITNMSYQVQ